MGALSFADVGEGVRATIAAYTQAVDDGRPDDVVATFCIDGSCNIPGMGAHQGHDELRAAYATLTPRRPQRHLVLNTHITAWNDQEATAISDLVFMLQGEAGWAIELVGRYHDTFHHDDGRWLIHHRAAEFVPEDPYPYFDWLRAQCPVRPEQHHDVLMVTGYEEARAVYTDPERFSSATSVTGPFPGFSVPLEGDDISDIIEEHRDGLPFSDQLPCFDPPKHTAHRALLMRLITPKRLRENEEFMWRLADRQLDKVVANGKCEFVKEFGGPFALLVVAELLGVPEAEHETFLQELQGGHREGMAIGSTGGQTLGHTPLEFLYERFTGYLEARRREPRDDVLTGLAKATFPDGSLPEVIDVVRIAANLFGAGQETTVRLLTYMLYVLAEHPEMQDLLREKKDLIPNFIEEALRMESPVKGDFRLSRVRAEVGGVDVPPGTTVMVVNGAANRDPAHFDDPNEFQVERENARHHLAFGLGIHVCPGAPLARAEAKVSLERILDRTRDITVSEEHHGPPGARRFRYTPTFILRGMDALHLEYTPVD
jgi:cytochrome P450